MRRLLLATMVLAACGEWTQDALFTEADFQLLGQMALPPEPAPDPTNRFASSPDAAALGQALFFDTELSNPPGISCATCHDPKAWFIDTRSTPNNVSIVFPAGVTDAGTPLPPRVTKRNSASLVNVAHYRWWAWDGRSDSLWMQCGVAYEAQATMAGSRPRIGQLMAQRYGTLMREAGVPDRSGFADNEAAALAYKALAAYLSTLNSANAPFDRFVAGDRQALSPDAQAGLKLFIGKAGCIECHSGPAFNGNASAHSELDFYRSVGIAQRGANVQPVDLGRAEGIPVLLNKSALGLFNSSGPYNDAPRALDRVSNVVPRPSDVGVFRIKSLRQVAQTGPYMHAGQLATLEDVVHFYNVGGDASGYSGERDRAVTPLFLTPDEERQLVQFLASLTGDPVPCRRQCDTSVNPDPKNLCSRCSP